MKDAEFRSKFELTAATIFTICDTLTVDQETLFSACRTAFRDQKEQRLSDRNGRDFSIAIQADVLVLGFRLEEEGEPKSVSLPELGILSSDASQRISTLDEIIEQFGPTAPDHTLLRREAEKRELTDDEIKGLLQELRFGVAALQVRIDAGIRYGAMTIEELVPDDLCYYERFCGPDPASTSPSDYLSNVLPDHRKELLDRELVRGLDICLLGSLHDGLAPGAWTTAIGDDELWNAIFSCGAQRDPVSLLGALDIALYRQHDDRYRAYAEDAVKKLTAEQFLRPDGVDTYELVPLLARLVLDRISVLEGGATRQPYWKRICAWMQAGLLGRTTLGVKVNVDELRRWVEGRSTAAAHYAALLDLRCAPMSIAGVMSAEVLRGEIVGRLIVMRERHKAAGRQMPLSTEVDDAVSRLAEDGLPLTWAYPGPLEGYCRPTETPGRMIPAERNDEVIKALNTKSLAHSSYMAACLSQFFELGDDVLDSLQELCAGISGSEEEVERRQQFEALLHLCFVAVAQRDAELAQSIFKRVKQLALRSREAEVPAVLQVVVFASAAIENEDAWVVWLESRLFDLASCVPAGKCSQALLEQLNELKKVLDLTLGIHSRAEAMASAAV